MPERYPGYDVLNKKDGPSWNDATRHAIDGRLSVPRQPRFFTQTEWETLSAVCDRILPQQDRHKPIPLPAYVDAKITDDHKDGYRYASLPDQGEAWRRGLAAIDQEAQDAHGRRFHLLSYGQQDALLHAMQKGELTSPAWGGMPCKPFFEHRVIADVTHSYYSHPESWNEIGFGGPASPRGYVRMELNRRDTWEAVEAKPGAEEHARRANAHVR